MNIIVILEDDRQRALALRNALEAATTGVGVFMTDDASEAIKIMANRANEIMAASLDHDLGDPQLTGTDVVLAMAKMPPSYPVFVHSSNSSAGTGMVKLLQNAGWSARYIGRNGEAQEAWLATWVSTIRDTLT